VVELIGREIRIRTVDEVIAQAQTLARPLLGDRPEASVEAFLAEVCARPNANDGCGVGCLCASRPASQRAGLGKGA
jgi:hypothetical protein